MLEKVWACSALSIHDTSLCVDTLCKGVKRAGGDTLNNLMTPVTVWQLYVSRRLFVRSMCCFCLWELSCQSSGCGRALLSRRSSWFNFDSVGVLLMWAAESIQVFKFCYMSTFFSYSFTDYLSLVYFSYDTAVTAQCEQKSLHMTGHLGKQHDWSNRPLWQADPGLEWGLSTLGSACRHGDPH